MIVTKLGLENGEVGGKGGEEMGGGVYILCDFMQIQRNSKAVFMIHSQADKLSSLIQSKSPTF